MSRIEGNILAAVWLLTVAASVHAISSPPPPPVAWLPVAHKYQGGDYVGSVALEPVRAWHDCTELASRINTDSAEDPHATPGSGTRAGCVPVPPAPVYQ
jgi:hypothetical protein